MDFNSTEDIISHFELKTQNGKEIKKELKKLIKKVHPDINKGEFKDTKDESLYHEIQSALHFFETKKSNNSLSLRNENTDLMKIISDLTFEKKQEKIVENINAKNLALTDKLQESIVSYHKVNSAPKITGIVITSIITSLWAFPTVIKEHPILKTLYNYNAEFTIVWIISLLLTAILWIKINSSEKRDEEIKRGYKLESNQNYIFSIFIKWLLTNHQNYEYIDNQRIITFSKDDLIFFLMTRFDVFQQRLKRLGKLETYEIQREVEHIEKHFEEESNRNKKGITPYSLLKNLIPKPGKIDAEIAQLISDLIIDRLKAKEVITQSVSKSLSDKYIYKD
ncbi:hypothetical protein BD847_0098 [Flavobacterium cutihirudinis]|uniref:J domain-containing protein n=1 Tax=Flavobacterium cutihirudinis TaxID=1265740 RepID=A0A3D9FYY0_9FLAO|nr:hypothetical protein [Flavobacterium cutihirudinis]RED26185.1 hypothetical protein BD847_0098 [Flavobacterium cutihirudinis]